MTIQFIKNASYYLILIVVLLSVINVFSLPAPIRPKTSVGVLTLIALVWLGLNLFNKTKIYLKQPIDILVFIYVIWNLLSTLVNPDYFTSINIRVLVLALIFYLATRLSHPTQEQKQVLIFSIGSLTIFIAFLSILQILLPDLMNLIALNYFSGKDAYGLIIDYNRGRLLHWGIITISFPFFYATSWLIKAKQKTYAASFFILGFLILSLAMFISNFRWTLFCFMIVSVIFLKLLIYIGQLTYSYIKYFLFGFLATAIVGLILTNAVFGYNMLDRFLLKDHGRDVAESLGRVFLFNQAIDLFRSSPIFGVGYGNYIYLVDPHELIRFYSIFDQLEFVPEPVAAHNEFFTILAESGIIGFISFLLIIILTYRRIITYLFFSPKKFETIDQLLLISVFTAYLGFTLYALFENIYPHNIILVFILSAVSFTWFKPVKI